MRKIISVLIVVIVVFGMTSCSKDVTNQAEESMSVEDLYRFELGSMLKEKLGLAEYDKELSDSELNYIANSDDYKTEAQRSDKMYLEYIYLANELHLERLSGLDYEIIESAIKEGNVNGNTDVREVVERTFNSVISYSIDEADEGVETSYRFWLTPQIVPVNSLVLAIGTMGEFNELGEYECYECEYRKTAGLKEFASRMEEELSGMLGDTPIIVCYE